METSASWKNTKKWLSKHNLNDQINILKRNHQHSANRKHFNNENGHSILFSEQKNSKPERVENLLDVTKDLWDKRKSFNDQMLINSERREQLKKDLHYLHKRKVKCQLSIRENDAKRWRALQKFCTDNHLCTIRTKEKHQLKAELQKAKEAHATLSAKAADLRKYENYMMKVIGSLPKDYIKLADDVIAGLMMRYNTLYATNSRLRQELEAKSEEVRIAQSDLKRLVEAHRILLLGKDSELSELYTHWVKMNDEYQGAQQSLIHSHDELAHQERTLAMRSIISQLACDTGKLPISICSRPELEPAHSTAVTVASASEFTLLSRLTSAQNEVAQ
ncbi:hypothetical protein P879_06128 [Paragonimus westermani]|uniref:DUF4200 domain-containing protein n=1 Tax=Paragonimus westermani TaxID=34504 RepID=A0A8T0D6S7_9TREM|nr:hypothetical protein P879_06128 [Paragonimus westermani]